MALTISVSFASLHLTVDKQELASLSSTAGSSTTLLSFVDLKNTLSFVQLVATDIRLDPDTKNLYFIGDNPNALTISLGDSPALSVSKSQSDSLSIAEESVFSFNSVQSDTFGITESLSRVMSFVRAFTDQPTLVDSPAISFSTTDSDSFVVSDDPVLNIQSAKSDTFDFTDSEVLSVDPAKSETLSVTDAPVLDASLPKSDSTTISESDIKEFIKAVPANSGDVTFTVTVASGTSSYGTGNKYHINGIVSAGLILNEGFTYIFDQSDYSNSGHPLRFSTTANGTHNSGTEYTTNITTSGTPGSSGAFTKIVVTSSTPDLHYYCSNHSGMGAETSIQASGDTTFAVTVATGVNSYGSGNKYHLDGVITPLVHLISGNTYTFDQSDSSNSNHPFRFSVTGNGTHASGSAYSTGVSIYGTPGYSGAYSRISVTSLTPSSLHYYCANHSGMGDSILIQTLENVEMSESLARVVTYSRTFSDAYTLDDVASPSDDLRTDFGINKNNIFSITESLNYAISTSKSDTTSLTDSPSIEFISAFADSITLSELLVSGAGSILLDSTSLSDQEVISSSKALSDTASITESINVVLISGSSSVLNTSAFNTSVLN